MARAGLAIAIFAAVIAALLFASAARHMADHLESHVAAGMGDGETAAFSAGRARAFSDGGFVKQHHSYPILLSGSEATV